MKGGTRERHARKKVVKTAKKLKRINPELELIDDNYDQSYDIQNNPKLYEFSLKFQTYINQIFGDTDVRDFIFTLNPDSEYNTNVTYVYGSNFPHHYLKKIKHLASCSDNTCPHDLCNNPVCSNAICSIKMGLQNIYADTYRRYVDPFDFLCQSYSILFYLYDFLFKDDKLNIEKITTAMTKIKNRYKSKFGYSKIYKIYKKCIQMKMIRVYRELLNNELFKKKFTEILKQKQVEYNNYKHKKKNKDYIWRDYENEKLNKNGNPIQIIPLEIDEEEIIKKINETLDEWREFGYEHFIGIPGIEEDNNRQADNYSNFNINSIVL